MTEGYQALHSGAALLDLSNRGRIYATGEDRARLLHAMTTNHIQQLTPGSGCYAFFLNAQGRILADVNVFCFEEHLLLDTEPETREPIYQHLDKFIIADDVTLDDASSRTFAFGIEGPAARAAVLRAGANAPDVPFAHVQWEAWTIANVSLTGAPGFRIFGESASKPELLAKLATTGVVDATATDARLARIEHFKPRFGDEILPTNLAQETQLPHALHFSKGCYLGQEIVERVRSRGHVNRVLTGLEIDGSGVPDAGTKLQSGGKDVGEIRSAAWSPSMETVVAVAYARVQAGSELEVGGSRAVLRPPWTLAT